MKAVFAVLLLFVCDEVKSQCYDDSEIAIHWTRSSDQCLANYTLFNENVIDDNADKGVTCSRRGSAATDGTWTYETDGSVVTCGVNSGQVRCEREPGSVTLYTRFEGANCCPSGNYTCCIEGLCISIRVYQENDFAALFPNMGDAIIESCSIMPPSDVTVIPQQYTVQMITSGVPPVRLFSSLECTDCDGTNRGELYYILIDLTDERYQYSVPVTWNADTNSINHQYSCRVRFGGTGEHGQNRVTLPTTKAASINASNIPTINNYEVINATAVMVRWSITGNVTGFVINITSSGLSTVTQQLTDSSAREFIYDRILPERNYTIEVRGYYELIGPAGTSTVRLEAGINSVNGSLISISDDLSTHQIQVNCYTFRVGPVQVTWSNNSVLITPDSIYQPVNGSELLDGTDQTYRHYITLTGSFSDGNTISCTVSVNGETRSDSHVLQVASSPPTGLSATILSSTSLRVSWTQLPDVTGYIMQYTPNGQTRLLNRTNTLSDIFEGLTQGTTYQINVYSYRDLLSVSSSEISVLLDVPNITSFNAQPMAPTSAMVSWNTLNSIINNYTVSYIRLCDNTEDTMLIEDGTTNTTTINNLYPGLQYFVSITPVNTLGKGMERTDSVALEESGPPTGAPLLQPPIVINSTAVRLSWGEVNCTQRNGVIIGYSIHYNTEGGPRTIVNVTEVTTVIITGLTQFSLYNISVAAINNNGIGPYSKAFTFYTTMTGTANIGAVIGSAFGVTCISVLVTFALLIAAILLIRKKLYGRRKQRLDSKLADISNQSSGEIVTYNRTSEYVDVNVSESIEKLYSSIDDTKIESTTHEPEGLYVNTSMTTSSFTHEFDPNIPVVTPISVEDLGHYVFECHKNMNRKLKEELMSLYDGSDKTCDIGQSDEN